MHKYLFRTLRSQMWLLSSLFAVCIVAAVVMASQHTLFEQWVAERYQPLPSRLESLAEAAVAGSLDQAIFTSLSTADLLALYDVWMTHSTPLPSKMPAALVDADAALYLARAERTLVTGGMEQKLRAVTFLELAGSPQALTILHKIGHWAALRRLPELAARIATAAAGNESVFQE